MEPAKIYYPKSKRGGGGAGNSKANADDDYEYVPKQPKPSEEVRSFGALDGKSLLAYYQNHGSIKLVGEACPFLPQLVLRDASFKDRHKEDDLYLRDPEAVARLRRGNSLVVANNSTIAGLSEPIITRRGLPKFFDLRKEHLKVFLGEQTTEQLTSNCGQSALFEYKNILAPVLTRLKQGQHFNVYRSGKANGENAQISLVRLPHPITGESIDLWVVCSKNVSLLMRNETDLKQYTDQRFSYAKMIGACWLRIFAKLDAAKQEEVKTITSQCTLVGEYCGHAHLQHLVRYPEETLIFYAIVPKDCSAVSWDMNRTFKWLESVGLEKVTLECAKGLKTAAELAKVVDDYNDYLALSDVQTEGEGSVVYFEAYDSIAEGEPAKIEVISMCKLKTLEYRFLRKMREKIKGQIRHGNSDFTKTLSKFEKESHELVGEYPEALRPKLPNIDQYKDLLNTGLSVVIGNSIPLEVVERSFLDVLELVRVCHTGKRAATKEEVAKLIEKASQAEALENLEDGVAANSHKQSLDGPTNGKSDDNVVNVCVIDIPGLFNITSLIQEAPKAGFQLKIDYDQKKTLTKDTIRVVNLAADSIDTKKLKPNTFLIVPVLSVDQLPEPLMRKFRTRVESYFEQSVGDKTGILARYLKSTVNSINKVTNIEHSVQLSLNKVSRIAKTHKRVSQLDVSHVLKSAPTDNETDEGLLRLLLKEAERIRAEHTVHVGLKRGTDGTKAEEEAEEMDTPK